MMDEELAHLMNSHSYNLEGAYNLGLLRGVAKERERIRGLVQGAKYVSKKRLLELIGVKL